MTSQTKERQRHPASFNFEQHLVADEYSLRGEQYWCKVKHQHVIDELTGADGSHKPCLQEIEEYIGTRQLNEAEANDVLAFFGYERIGAYLAFAHTIGVNCSDDSHHNLRVLISKAVHSWVLGVDILYIEDYLSDKERPRELSDDQFGKLKQFIEQKIMPLIRHRKYPTIKRVIIDDIISRYDSIDARTQGMLKSWLDEASRPHDYLQGSSEMIERVMGIENNHGRTLEGLPTKIQKQIDQIIQELRSNPRVAQPTIFEQILLEFRSNGFQSIDISVLSDLFQGVTDPERSVHAKISMLNHRLAKIGLKIGRRSAYYLTKSDED